MFSVRQDSSKNRLYISLGTIKVNDTCAVVNTMVKNASKLQKGFTVLLDLTKYKPTSEIVTKQVCTGIEFMEEQGMGKAVRVSRSQKAMMEMDVTCQPVNLGMKTVPTVADAEKDLDWWVAEQKSTGELKRKHSLSPLFTGELFGPQMG